MEGIALLSAGKHQNEIFQAKVVGDPSERTNGAALGVANVVELLLPRFLQHKVDGGREVVHCHLMEAATQEGEVGYEAATREQTYLELPCTAQFYIQG